MVRRSTGSEKSASRQVKYYGGNMIKLLLLSISLLTSNLHSGEAPKTDSSVYEVDIDCDGKAESFYIRYVENDFIIETTLTSDHSNQSLRFGLAQPARHDAICGRNINISHYPSDAALKKEFESNGYSGYKYGEQCFDLTIRGGECDSINIFYNHKNKALAWWRN